MRPDAGRRAALVSAVFAGLLGLSGLRCLDVWLHLRTGAMIWETGAIPHVDTLSHTRPGAPWVTHEWAFEVPLYGIWRVGGDAAMVAVQASLAALAFYVLVRVNRAAGAAPLAAALAGMAGAVVATTRFLPRPHMVSAVLTGLLLWLGVRHLQAPTRRSWLAVPICLLWANVHAGVVIGLGILGAFAMQEAIRDRRPGRLSRIALASGAVTLLNPNGVDTLIYPFFLVKSNDAGLFDILELRRPEPPSLVHGWILVLALTAAVAWRRAGLALVVIATVGAVLGATRIRASLDAVLMGAPVVALGLGRLFELVRLPPLPAAPVVGLTGAAALALLGWRPDLQVEPWAIPSAAMRFVNERGLTGEMLNAHAFGAWLLWAHPEHKVFFDGRNEVFVDLFREVDELGIDRISERYQLGFAVIEYPSEHDVREVDVPVDLTDDLVLNPAWGLVYFDDIARVYARSVPGNERILALDGYRLLRPGWSDFTYIERHASGPTSAEFELESRRAVAAAPDAVVPKMHLVEFLRMAGRVEEALGVLDELPGDDPFVLSRRGALLLQIGRTADARDALERGVAAIPDNAVLWSNLGLARLQLAELAGAERALRTAIELDPELIEARRNLSSTLQRAGDVTGAQIEAQNTAKVAMDSARTHFQAGQQLLQGGYAERAAAELERTVRLSPDNPNAHYLLGVAYNVAGDPARADAALSRCLSIEPRHPYAILELAGARASLGRAEDARALLTQFLASGPEEKWAQVARQKLATLGPGGAP